MSDEYRQELSIGVVTAFELLLMSVTWPLWFGRGLFPEVALFQGLIDVSRTWHVVTAGVFVTGLLLLTCGAMRIWPSARERSRRAAWVSAGTLLAGIVLVILNQHCLQAWHWFCLLCLLQRVLLPATVVTGSLRMTVTSVYVCSALSRLSPDLVDTLTGQMAEQLLKLAGLPMQAASPSWVATFAWLLTIGEFLTGLLLVGAWTRRAGVACSLLLHSALILVLGPVGLGHHPGVLLWNTMFLMLVPVLFGSPFRIHREWSASPENGFATVHERSRWRGRALVANGLILLLPVSGLLGIFDNWPSWQLYSPRPEVWKLLVDRRAVEELPDTVQVHVSDALPLSDWHPVRMDRWALSVTGAPLYPEDRFQMAVIEWLTRGITRDDAVRIEIDSPVPFPWWQRTQRQLPGRDALLAERDRFWLNSRAGTRPSE